MDNSPTTPVGALAEINQFQAGTHPLFEPWSHGDTAAKEYRANLFRVAYPAPVENPQADNQPEQAEQRDTAQRDERQPDNVNDDAEKNAGIEQLHAKNGDQYETVARNAGEAWQYFKFDPRDAQVNERIEALGNDPDLIELLADTRPLLGDLVNHPAEANIDHLSESEKLALGQKAIIFLSNGQIQSPRFIGLAQKVANALADVPEPEQINYFARLGQKLFSPVQVIDNTEPKPAVKVDSSAPGAKAAQDEINNIRAGQHKLSESWKRGDESARSYMSQLYQRTTGNR